MSSSNTYENELLLLEFNNTNIADVGDATGLRGSTAAGNVWIHLHTADPGETGVSGTNAPTYTGYAPVSVARTVGGWTVTGNQVANAATVQFAECTAGSASITHASICKGSGASAVIMFRCTLAATRSISAGITPLFNPGEIVGTRD